MTTLTQRVELAPRHLHILDNPIYRNVYVRNRKIYDAVRTINVCIYLRCASATCERTIKAAYALNSHATCSRSTGSMALHQHNRLPPR